MAMSSDLSASTTLSAGKMNMSSVLNKRAAWPGEQTIKSSSPQCTTVTRSRTRPVAVVKTVSLTVEASMPSNAFVDCWCTKRRISAPLIERTPQPSRRARRTPRDTDSRSAATEGSGEPAQQRGDEHTRRGVRARAEKEA
eukprot:6176366-Pleurochrysis_carterae.AAC.2